VLHSHHKTEEEVYFPLLDSMCSEGKKGVEAKNHAEHETFLPGLARFDAFVNSWKDGEREEGKVAWDGKILKSLIDDFGPKLASHLSSEIVSLESLASDEAIDWELLGKTMAAHSKKVADRVRTPIPTFKSLFVCVSTMWYLLPSRAVASQERTHTKDSKCIGP
jgi:hypothetical protein